MSPGTTMYRGCAPRADAGSDNRGNPAGRRPHPLPAAGRRSDSLLPIDHVGTARASTRASRPKATRRRASGPIQLGEGGARLQAEFSSLPGHVGGARQVEIHLGAVRSQLAGLLRAPEWRHQLARAIYYRAARHVGAIRSWAPSAPLFGGTTVLLPVRRVDVVRRASWQHSAGDMALVPAATGQSSSSPPAPRPRRSTGHGATALAVVCGRGGAEIVRRGFQCLASR